MAFLVWVRTPKGPSPQLWSVSPAELMHGQVDGYWHEKQSRVLAFHSISAEMTKSLDELAAMFPVPAGQEI